MHVHHHQFDALLAQYGYGIVGLVIGLESLGLPLPGETVLVAAALYAGSTGRLDIALVVLAAAAGGIAGNILGFSIGRSLGAPALERHGPRLGFDARRQLLGQYLFRHYGAFVIVLARFIPFLRAFVSLLAGANRMPPGRFLVWAVVSALIWTSAMGYGAHALGKQVERLAGPVGIALAIAVVVAIVVGFVLLHRHERRWIDIAERDAASWALVHSQTPTPPGP